MMDCSSRVDLIVSLLFLLLLIGAGGGIPSSGLSSIDRWGDIPLFEGLGVALDREDTL